MKYRYRLRFWCCQAFLMAEQFFVSSWDWGILKWFEVEWNIMETGENPENQIVPKCRWSTLKLNFLWTVYKDTRKSDKEEYDEKCHFDCSLKSPSLSLFPSHYFIFYPSLSHTYPQSRQHSVCSCSRYSTYIRDQNSSKFEDSYR